jgi:hypothetical protein
MRRHRWVWYFLLLAVLATAGVVINVVYNLRIQLKPEQLAEARQRWREHGAADYSIDYSIKIDEEPAEPYRVEVRGGRVMALAGDGEVRVSPLVGLAVGPALPLLPPAEGKRHTVEGLFDQIGERLRQDAESGSRNYATATFDRTDGRPTRYVHRVAGTRKRLEWNVKLRRVDADGQAME